MEKAGAEPKATRPASKGTAARRPASSGTAAAARPARSRGVVTGKLSRNSDDGFRSDLLPGIRSSADVLTLAQELTIAEARLGAIAGDQAGPWSIVADHSSSVSQAFVAALVVAVSSPDETAASTATAIAANAALEEIISGLGDDGVLAGSEAVAGILDAGPRGPRGHDASGGALAVPAQLAQRSGGSLEAALAGEPSWTPERRFARLLDRLALKGLPRAVRYDILIALGRSGALDVRPGALHLGSDQVTDAAKRLWAIADVPLLEKRAAAVVEATGVTWDALELALWNIAGADASGSGAAARWSTAKPSTTLGLPGEVDEDLALTIAAALGD